MSLVFLSVAMVYPFKSEFMVLYALVQAGAGNVGQVVAKGFGAGQVPVYVALGFAGHLGGVVGKFHSLRACAAVRSILRWCNLRHLKFAARMQRFPNRYDLGAQKSSGSTPLSRLVPVTRGRSSPRASARAI